MSLKSIGSSPNGLTGFLKVMFTVLLFSSNCKGAAGSPNPAVPRVVGEKPAPEGRFPYMCSIRRPFGEGHDCGGVLINENWVLTAAHCLNEDQPNDPFVAGMRPPIFCDIYKIDDPAESKRFSVSRCVFHHLWNGTLLGGNDIALCRLKRPASFKFPKLSISGQTFTANSLFSVVGWGKTSAGDVVADVLQIGNRLNYMPLLTCNKEGPWPGLMKSSMICAGFGTPSTCEGDSGGPLLIPHDPDSALDKGDPERDVIAGITSFGLGDCEAKAPSGYTRISCYRSWITCITEEKGQDCSVDKPCGEGSSLCTDIPKSATFDKNDALERMLKAISSKDSDEVKKILCEGLNPNSVSGKNDDPLLQSAAAYNSPESAKVLVQGGAHLDNQNSFGQSAMQRAAGKNFVTVLQLLINRGANIEVASPGGWRPLINAAGDNHLEALKTLLDSGANIEGTTNPGLTALHFSAKENAVDTAKELISRGANIEAKTKDGYTPLHMAAAYGHPAVAKVLLDGKASKTSTNKDGETPIEVICMAKDLKEPCKDSVSSELEKLLKV